MKGRIIAAAVLVLALVGGVLFVLNHLENYDEFYTQVDNSKIQELSTNDDMKYEYTLDCYSQNGNKRELRFQTDRQLREGAYLSVEVWFLGVRGWEEVQYDALPQKVREKYAQ